MRVSKIKLGRQYSPCKSMQKIAPMIVAAIQDTTMVQINFHGIDGGTMQILRRLRGQGYASVHEQGNDLRYVSPGCIFQRLRLQKRTMIQ